MRRDIFGKGGPPRTRTRLAHLGLHDLQVRSQYTRIE